LKLVALILLVVASISLNCNDIKDTHEKIIGYEVDVMISASTKDTTYDTVGYIIQMESGKIVYRTNEKVYERRP
jgi:hypothetical protein